MPVDHSQNIIEVENISFSYGVQKTLKNITFEVHRGDYLSIVGPNGGGKTTLLKIILGLLKPSAGAVKLFSSKIGYVPQKVTAFDTLFPATAYEIAAMGRYSGRGLFKRLNKADRKKIDEALTHVEMEKHKDKLIGDLSGGEQQRVFIARALACEPEILFLDEPTVGVDIQTQEQFYQLMRKLNKELGITLILVSHDIDIVAHESTEVAFINCKLVYYGLSADFIKSDKLVSLYGKEVKFLLHKH